MYAKLFPEGGPLGHVSLARWLAAGTLSALQCGHYSLNHHWSMEFVSLVQTQ